jgi:hypothetical protein
MPALAVTTAKFSPAIARNKAEWPKRLAKLLLKRRTAFF